MSTTRRCQIEGRGYAITSSLKFINELEAPTRTRILEAIPAEIRNKEYTPIGFYPVDELSVVLNAIAASANNDDKKAYDMLVKCGQFIARDATNTFLRLLMRIMTPKLFASRLPTLWARDHKAVDARLEVPHVGDNEMIVTWKGCKNYDHMGPVGAGWVTFTLTQMGSEIVSQTCQPWSIAAPGPDEVSVEVHWKG